MDLIVRFWDNQKNRIVTRYLDSQFLGHTRAADLLERFKFAKKVDVGFGCKLIIIQTAEADKKASQLQVFEFKRGCLVLLQKLSNKLLERYPLQYSVVRNLICLDPKYIANSPESAVSKCSNLLQHLITKKIKSPDSSDTVLKQYKSLVSNVQKYDKDDFKSYRPSEDKRLDSFLYEEIGEKTEYAELWELAKEMLTLSHSQSSVEREQ